MAFDKVKTLRAAERYLELGKIPAAVKEYCKIVEDDPDDFTTLNMLGDLYVRVGNPPAAIACFRRIAEHYREQDFALKAIAMFKKIDRLQPNDAAISTSSLISMRNRISWLRHARIILQLRTPTIWPARSMRGWKCSARLPTWILKTLSCASNSRKAISGKE